MSSKDNFTETFTFGSQRFLIGGDDGAESIVAGGGCELITADIDQIMDFYRFIHVDKEHAASVDSDKPGILGTVMMGRGKDRQETLMPIDGRHRAEKRRQEGHKTMQFYVLTREQTESIDISAPRAQYDGPGM